MPRWGMVFDLKKCCGCQTCFISCKIENFLPAGMYWNHVYDYETGEYPHVKRNFLPTVCMHCDEPGCLEVCPTGATIKREDGIVYVDYDKCIGCRYCMMACPYKARYFNDKIKNYYPGNITVYEAFPKELRAEFQRHEPGIVSKCTFCMHRVDRGLSLNLIPGIDPEATPACVVNCPAQARYFGDLDDPESEVAQLISKRSGYQLQKHLGADPSVYYLK
ncbi:MAG: 4Fe-4S dicluster domain-containing protein [Dehalococcoidia bacterium]|nr:4Fe-4S dicluster domain-containing protein [Dehalococcoidia bacterium]MDZ4245511.1 4Fe-4S dicluster domain-containing protein [Dehalococcoidia bacterium]